MIKRYENLQNYEIVDLCISKDNSQFTTVGGDREIFVWDAKTSNLIRKFSGHLARINTIWLQEENSLIVTGSYDANVKLWDLKSSNKQAIQSMKLPDSVTKVHIRDANIYAASVDGSVHIFDVRRGLKYTDTFRTGIHNLSLSNDGRSYMISCLNSTLCFCDISDGTILKEYKDGHRTTQFKSDVRYSWDDSWAVTGSEDGKVVIYDILTGNIKAELKNHCRAVVALDLSPMKDSLLSGSFDNTITLWA